jgi:hypothetical protein
MVEIVVQTVVKIVDSDRNMVRMNNSDGEQW